MHEHDESIITRSNVRSDVVVVNQCDKDEVRRFTFTAADGCQYNAIYVYTTERGLSRSRNMAISYAPDDAICQICDDDEIIADDATKLIKQAYSENPNASVITFKIDYKNKTFGNKTKILSFKSIMSTSSVQITFQKKAIVSKNIKFDTKMGSGSGNGGGEEAHFLLTCRRKHLKILFCPYNICRIIPSESNWFSGYDSKYMKNMGWSSRRSLGATLGIAYLAYWIVSHRNLYKNYVNVPQAVKNIIIGFFEHR